MQWASNVATALALLLASLLASLLALLLASALDLLLACNAAIALDLLEPCYHHLLLACVQHLPVLARPHLRPSCVRQPLEPLDALVLSPHSMHVRCSCTTRCMCDAFATLHACVMLWPRKHAWCVHRVRQTHDTCMHHVSSRN